MSHENLTHFTVNLKLGCTFVEFIDAFNLGFCHKVDGEWSGNLDAFHDYLSWPTDEEYELTFTGWHNCAAMLEQEKAGGETLLAHFQEIFAENPHVKLNLN